MSEIFRTLAGAGLWLGVPLLIAFAVNRASGRAATDARALLTAWPLFFMLEVVSIKLLDVVHRVDAWAMLVLHVLMAAAAAACAVAVTRSRPAPAAERAVPAHDGDTALARRIVIACLCTGVAALAFFSLITPVHVWDVQAYHMPMVASYIQGESLAPWPAQDLRQIYRVNGAELQMLALALLARSDAWVELTNAVALAVSLVAAFHIARLVLRRDMLAWLAVILVFTAPQILLGSVTAKNDIVFMALVLCAFYWTLRIADEPALEPKRRLAIAGAIAALAVATKVMGFNLLGAVGLVLLALALRRRLPWHAPALFGLSALVLTAVLVGDVYWQNFMRSETVPVGTMPGEVRFTSGWSNLTAAAHFYLYDLSFRRLVNPQVIEHDFSHYGYLFPFLLVLGSAVAARTLFRWRTSGPVPATLSLLVLALFISVIAVRQPIGWDQRFMIWMVPAFAVLAALLLRHVETRSLLALVAFAAAFGLGNLFRTFTDASDGLFRRSAVHLVQHGELAMLHDVAQPKYMFKIDGYAALDSVAMPGDSVLYVGWEDTWMYPAWGRRFARHVRGVQNAADVEERLGTGTWRFVVVEDDALPELKASALRVAAALDYRDLVQAEGRRILQRAGNGQAGAPREPARDE